QAYDLYQASTLSSRRAKPLLDYYAILNLSKFVLGLSRPDLLPSRNPRHGLGLARQTVSRPREARMSPSPGVFSALHQMLAHSPASGSFTAGNALSQLCEVQAEYEEGWGGESRLMGGLAWVRYS